MVERYDINSTLEMVPEPVLVRRQAGLAPRHLPHHPEREHAAGLAQDARDRLLLRGARAAVPRAAQRCRASPSARCRRRSSRWSRSTAAARRSATCGVRRAVAMAIDWHALARTVYLDVDLPDWGDIFPRSWAYTAQPDPAPYDPAKARALLDEPAGKPAATGIRAKDGKRLELEIMHRRGRDHARERRSRDPAADARGRHRSAGAQRAREHAVRADRRRRAASRRGKFDLGIYAWTKNPDPDDSQTAGPDYLPPHGANYSRVADARARRLAASARTRRTTARSARRSTRSSSAASARCCRTTRSCGARTSTRGTTTCTASNPRKPSATSGTWAAGRCDVLRQLRMTDRDAWIRRSDALAEPVAALYALAAPEAASQSGLTQADAHTTDLSEGWRDRVREAAFRATRDAARARRRRETDARVREDIDILLRAAGDVVRGIDVDDAHLVQLIDVARIAFAGMRVLLDEQNPLERKQLALVRLRRYAGLEPNAVPLADAAEAETRARLRRRGPTRAVRRRSADRARAGPGADRRHRRAAARVGLGRLARRVRRVARAVRRVRALRRGARCCRARAPTTGCRPRCTRSRCTTSASTSRRQSSPRARTRRSTRSRPRCRRSHRASPPSTGFAAHDYRDVIRALKAQQIHGDADAIVDFYRRRLDEIEAIVRRENLVALPERPARIRVATVAESAETPAAHMNPAPLVGNTGQVGEFVLPLDVPPAAGEQRHRARGRLHARRGDVDADRARSAPGPRSAVRPHAARRALARARRVRVQLGQRRRLGALRRAHRAAVHAARGTALLAADAAAPRGARVPRSRAAERRAARPAKRRRCSSASSCTRRRSRAARWSATRFARPARRRRTSTVTSSSSRCARKPRRRSARASTSARSTTSSSSKASSRPTRCAPRCSSVSSRAA